MKLYEGARMWIPCKVKRGPFPDERMILAQADDHEWVGFVKIEWLKDKKESGDDQVLAHVVEVNDKAFKVRIPGSSFGDSLFEGPLDRVAASGSRQA